MKDNDYRQALQDAIFGDAWEKFISHPEFPRWASYVKLLKSPKNDNIEGTERMINVLGEMILQDIGARQ